MAVILFPSPPNMDIPIFNEHLCNIKLCINIFQSELMFMHFECISFLVYSCFSFNEIAFAFAFWPPHGIWSSEARDHIWATAGTYVAAAATPDPLTHFAPPRPGTKPVSWGCRDAADPVAPPWELLKMPFHSHNFHIEMWNSFGALSQHSFVWVFPWMVGEMGGGLYSSI